MTVRLDADRAYELARGALLAAGAADEVAEVVAAHAVDSELAGHPSHGLRLIVTYCADAGKPGTDLSVRPNIVARRPAFVLIDAQGGLGHLALATAVETASSLAATRGVGAAAVRNCGHAGRAGAWAEQGAKAGCATLVALGGSAPPFVMAAGPGASAALHTNPLAIAVPATGHPLLLDVATSVVAEGKVRLALEGEGRLPVGSILSASGVSSSDPEDYRRGGSLLPMGGHKGFGMSAVIEALTVGLSGSDEPGGEPHEGALVLCIAGDVARSLADLESSVTSLRERIRASGSGSREVLAPGDPEAIRRESAGGIVEVADDVAHSLRALTQRSSIGGATG